jgi:hypothetical protein
MASRRRCKPWIFESVLSRSRDFVTHTCTCGHWSSFFVLLLLLLHLWCQSRLGMNSNGISILLI